MAGSTVRDRLDYDGQRCMSGTRDRTRYAVLVDSSGSFFLPPPTVVKEASTRLFDDKWLEEARKIIKLEQQRNALREKTTGEPS